jgi:hypothetical protein
VQVVSKAKMDVSKADFVEELVKKVRSSGIRSCSKSYSAVLYILGHVLRCWIVTLQMLGKERKDKGKGRPVQAVWIGRFPSCCLPDLAT